MTKEFINQNYLIIESNVVANIVVWNGDTTQWTPPSGSIVLIQSTTPAMIWELNSDATDFVLTQSIGAGEIAFTWDGTVLTTNEPKPPKPQPQPTTTGTQTA
jgi:hypothetical protein